MPGKTTTIRGGAAGEGLVPLCTRQVIGSVTDGTSVLLSYLEVRKLAHSPPACVLGLAL